MKYTASSSWSFCQQYLLKSYCTNMPLFILIQHFQGGFLKRQKSVIKQISKSISVATSLLSRRGQTRMLQQPHLFLSCILPYFHLPFPFPDLALFGFHGNFVLPIQASYISSNDVFAKDQVGLKHFPVNEFQISVFWKDPNWKGDKRECALPHILHQNGGGGGGLP